MSLAGFEFLLKTPSDNTIATQTALPPESDFDEIGGFTTNSFVLNANAVDVTTKSNNQNRTLLDHRGILGLDLSGSGFLQDTTIAKRLEVDFLSQSLRWFKMERADGRDYYAKCKITAYSLDGDNAGAVGFSISLMSSKTIYVRGPGAFAYDSGVDKVTAFSSIINPFEYFNQRSAEYALASIPAGNAARVAAFDTTLSAVTLLNANKSSGVPTTDTNLTAGTTAAMYSFIFLLLKKTDLANRQYQILDALDTDITNQFIPFGEYDDDTSVTWNALYYNVPLVGTANQISVKVQIGV